MIGQKQLELDVHSNQFELWLIIGLRLDEQQDEHNVATILGCFGFKLTALHQLVKNIFLNKSAFLISGLILFRWSVFFMHV
jgi:hypothetical protein